MIERGDLVRLKSGGPDMVVGRVRDSSCEASWVADGQLMQAVWPRSCLVKVGRAKERWN